MNFVVRLPGRIGSNALLITATAVPLTGLLRRDACTARARRLLARRGDDVTLVMAIGVHAGSFKAVCHRGSALQQLDRSVAGLHSKAGPHAQRGFCHR